jgi:hypothetical protein
LAGKAVNVPVAFLSMPDAELIEMLKQPVEICDPYDQNNDDKAIQDRFDLPLHWDESIHKPQQDACCNDRDEDGGKWHIVVSNRFSDSIPRGIVEKLRAIDSLCMGAIRKRRTHAPLQPYSSNSLKK